MDPKKLMFNCFKRYYRKNPDIVVPNNIKQREFGFILFINDEMIRHTAFPSREELVKYLKEKVPRHAYYSTAYYVDPSAPDMASKGWLGADLVFDIDVDHIPTDCKADHDFYLCQDCGGISISGEQCSVCGSSRIKKVTWVCEKCLDVAREHALRLIDILISDFGFSSNEIEIVFSGHRGYHIHVQNKDILELGQDGRREILDYVRGEGIDFRFLPGFNIPRKGSKSISASIDSRGWPGRIMRSLYNIILNLNENNFHEILSREIERDDLEYILENRSFFLEELENPDKGYVNLLKLRRKTLLALLESAVDFSKVIVDEKVTIDTKRLIRLPGSLHGKTGMAVRKILLSDLENKSPVDYAIVFAENEYFKIKAKFFPRHILDFKIEDRKGNGYIVVPKYIAIYLIGNASEIVEAIEVI
ncbi:MAG: hypothetical protein DRO65_00010 [Candidatus Altiarchaeales archaeon]|nr:MAG: hypothetical protein DRO65_00010 [Candidatus Altiarchaeales archaeon]